MCIKLKLLWPLFVILCVIICVFNNSFQVLENSRGLSNYDGIHLV